MDFYNFLRKIRRYFAKNWIIILIFTFTSLVPLSYLTVCLEYLINGTFQNFEWGTFLQDYIHNVKRNIILLMVFAIFAKFIFDVIFDVAKARRGDDFMIEEALRRGYRMHIFKKLAHDIDNIMQKYDCKNMKNNPMSEERLQQLQCAHHEMVNVVQAFRAQANKVLYPNVEEVLSSPEDVYEVPSAEELELLQSRMANWDFEVSDDFLENLINP